MPSRHKLKARKNREMLAKFMEIKVMCIELDIWERRGKKRQYAVS